jgi:hypothetical protein
MFSYLVHHIQIQGACMTVESNALIIRKNCQPANLCLNLRIIGSVRGASVRTIESFYIKGGYRKKSHISSALRARAHPVTSRNLELSICFWRLLTVSSRPNFFCEQINEFNRPNIIAHIISK